MFRFEAGSGVPIYRQLVEQVRRDVMLGRLRPDDQLPTVNEVAGWPGRGGWQVISQRATAGRTTALVRSGGQLPGPGLQDAAPAFDELVLGYLDGDTVTLPQEALT